MTLGLKDLYFAVITEQEDGSETYGTPKKMAGAMTAELSVATADGKLYVDDALKESDSEFANGTLKLGVDDLEQGVEVEVLGKTVDKNGVVWSGGEDNPPYIAVGFRAKKSGGRYRYIWLLKCRAKVPTEKYETKGESINYQTPEIELTFMRNQRDDAWKADFVGKPTDAAATTWFTSVPEKGDAAISA